MRKIFINQYKRLDIFQCNQTAHEDFNGRVSAYHVLNEKFCYPQGCLYFLWHCSRLQKGIPCVHGFRFVGSKCSGCTHYLEDKIHLQPRLLISQESYKTFLEEYEIFENWLNNIKYKQLNIACQIKNVKPWFEKVIYPGNESRTKLRGYLLVCSPGYFGIDQFNDIFYIRVHEKQMEQYQFNSRMKIELIGEIREDRGRIIIHKPNYVEIIKQGEGKAWNRNRALVAVKTAIQFKEQPDKCLLCKEGSLVDVFDKRFREEKRYRNLFCLNSIQDQKGCYIHALKTLKIDCSGNQTLNQTDTQFI